MMDFPHRRYNPLTQEWILVSPHRARRPWQGQVEKTPSEERPTYDPTCYLCPGNKRANGEINPAYPSTFAFDNDFAAILPPEGNQMPEAIHPIFQAEPVTGLCRVVCFSPRHDLTLPELTVAEIADVLRTWTSETQALGERDFIHYVQVFENKGAVMGCSNPHPHSQIWASSHIPNEPAKELKAQSEYRREHGGACLLCDYLEAETRSQAVRQVAVNEHFSAFVPFWAIWPFETLVVSHRHAASLVDLTPAEVTGLADVLRRLTARYDNLFETAFPYSMGFHQAPTDGQPHPEWHLHLHFYPPLLRSATVKKFMVGYEMLAMPQRDLTPETAAERLRSLSEQHYRAQRQRTPLD
jgi:UDPglucose--hexose-1-phosphate uridylyltransferase